MDDWSWARCADSNIMTSAHSDITRTFVACRITVLCQCVQVLDIDDVQVHFPPGVPEAVYAQCSGHFSFSIPRLVSLLNPRHSLRRMLVFVVWAVFAFLFLECFALLVAHRLLSFSFAPMQPKCFRKPFDVPFLALRYLCISIRIWVPQPWPWQHARWM